MQGAGGGGGGGGEGGGGRKAGRASLFGRLSKSCCFFYQIFTSFVFLVTFYCINLFYCV